MRKIIHVDMDAFYASVEARDDPALRGLPLAVGSAGARGVVMTASYEARKFGVRSAMPSSRALRLCPDLRFVPPRFEAYREVSATVRAIFKVHTDLVEPLSLDEAYLDVSDPKLGPASGTIQARLIKQEILKETGLSASAGVSSSKFLAKIASDLDKPNGLSVITPDRAKAFVAGLPVEKFFGVGPVTAKRMKELGIHTGADLRTHTEAQLREWFGKAGGHYYRICRAIDERPVNPEREHKSLGAETTFRTDLSAASELLGELAPIAATVEKRLKRAGLQGRTVTLKIKYADFTLVTRSRTLVGPVDSQTAIRETARDLLLNSDRPHKPIRLLGITLSNFMTEADTVQPALEFDL